MNYYENKMLQDRETRGFAASVGLFLTAPLFAMVGSFIIGIIVPSIAVTAFFGIWAAISMLSIFGAVGVILEKQERKRSQHA